MYKDNMKTKNQSPAFNEEVSYMRLFPETEFNNLTSAYTRDGQGAFFVSLMNIVTDETKIEVLEPINPLLPSLKLQFRRSDLWQLEITQKNADEEIPYLEKAVELLYKKFTTLSINENWESLATKPNISFIPYARPVQQIITGLKSYSTSLEKYAPFFAKEGYNDVLTSYAALGLSQYEVNVLVSESEPSVVDPVVFLIETGLTHEEMLELIYNGEVHSDTEALGKLFINADDSENPIKYIAAVDDKAAKFENLTASRMKRIQDFLILAIGTEWTYSALNTVLTSEGIWNEAAAEETEAARIVRITDNLSRLAKLSYMSQLLGIAPEKIQILGQAQNRLQGLTNVPYQQNTISSEQPQKDEVIMDGLYSAEGIAAITPEQLKNPEQSQRNVVLPVVNKLGITLSDLDTYLEFFSIQQLGIDELFDLVHFSQKLNENGMKLRAFITILIAVQQYDILAEKFADWLKNTRQKLDTTEQSYQQGNEEHNEHLQQLLFEQWTHELAVYWGDKNTSVYNVFFGISQQLNRNKTAEEPDGISQLNAFIRDSESDKQYDFFKSTYSFVSLVNQLSMDDASVQYVGNFLVHLDAENWSVQDFEKEDVQIILQFNHLYKQVDSSQRADFIIDLSAESFKKEDLLTLIDKNTHWPKESTAELLNSWGVADEDNSLVAVISWLEKLSYGFSVADATTLDAKDLLNYLKALQPESWKSLTELADAFIASIKAKEDAAILTKYRETYGEQLEKDRDRLVPTTLDYLHGSFGDIATPDHLSDYLLIDVEMSGIMNITPLREATDAVQTYLMRCKSGQEKVDLEKLKTITPSEWEWIPNFRIWQAEQNLREYPENYLQSTVRTTATDQFKKLLDTIQKDELTEELAKDGILNYVDDWYNLENAEIVDVSAYITHSAYFDKEVETIFFISRSQVVEGTFYYCWRDTDPDTQEVHWTPWQQINQKINAETVSGIYAFNRFNIFWSEQSTVTDDDPSVENGKYTIYSLTIKGIYQNLDGSWTPPKVVNEFPFYIDLIENSTLFKLAKGFKNTGYALDKYKPNQKSWKKVGVSAILSPDDTEQIQLYIGPAYCKKIFDLVFYTNKRYSIPNYLLKLNQNYEGNSSLTSLQSSLNRNFSNYASLVRYADDYIYIPINENNPNAPFAFLISPIIIGSDLNKRISDNLYGFERDSSFSANVNYKPKSSLAQSRCYSIQNYYGTFGEWNDDDKSADSDISMLSSSPISKGFAVRNKIGTFFIKELQASFLLRMNNDLKYLEPVQLKSCSALNQSYFSANRSLTGVKQKSLNASRVTNSTVDQLHREANKNGLDFLKRETQISEIGMPRTNFSDLKPNEQWVIPPSENSNNKINFEGAFGICARELFFHAPMAVGDLLSKSLQFEAARNWYHKVYNSLGVASTPETLKEVWQYGPFYEYVKRPQNIELKLIVAEQQEDFEMRNLAAADIPDGNLASFFIEEGFIYYETINSEGKTEFDDLFPSDPSVFKGNLLPIYFNEKQTIILNGSKINREEEESGVFSIVRQGSSWEMIAGPIKLDYSYCTDITVDSSGAKDSIVMAGVTYNNVIILQVSDDLEEWKYIKIESPELIRTKTSTYPSITYSMDKKELCLAYIDFNGFVNVSISTDKGNNWENPIDTRLKADKISITSGANGFFLVCSQNKLISIFHSDSVDGEWKQVELLEIKNDLDQYEFPQLTYNPNVEQLTLLYVDKEDFLNYRIYAIASQEEKITSLDPDIIAENNLQVYRKWTLEEYIRYLLQFGDNEFRQETWESLSAATQLYFEAEDVLGEEPDIEDLVSMYEKETRTYEKVQEISDHFGTATNEHLKALWELLKDRLYKLRNGLNINGERQMPSMYGSRIDPAQLVLAAQHGGINPYADSQLKNDTKVYRFRDLVPHTESMINMVISFGSQLYSALQQQDSEKLQMLQATHQVNLLNVVTEVLDLQIEEATKEVLGLSANLKLVENQRNYYAHLIEKGNLPLEAMSIASNLVSIAGFIAGSEIRGTAIAAHLIPTIFGFSDGGFQPGSSVDSAAQISGEVAQAAQTTAQILATEAEYQRRKEEWSFQLQQADYEVTQISAMLEAASQRLNIARANKKQHELSIKQSVEIVNYLNTKFTNQELYSWMSGQLASLYFTSYQLAFGALHTLQKAYQYELDEATNFIPANNWNSLRKGLLAGETLRLTLARMQDAYLNNNKRRQNVEAIISLKEFVKEDGWKKVEFNITKELLKANGEIVKIKSIAVSIPAVIGPYETFGATLTNDTTNEKITISKGINDLGVFPEEVNDGRYLPFEGIKIDETEKWTFECERFADRISDVILNVAFTEI